MQTLNNNKDVCINKLLYKIKRNINKNKNDIYYINIWLDFQ